MLKKKKHQSKSHDPLRSEKPKKNVAFSLADEENADVRYDNTDVTLDDVASPTFAGVRQRDFDMDCSVSVSVSDGEGGLTVQQPRLEGVDPHAAL